MKKWEQMGKCAITNGKVCHTHGGCGGGGGGGYEKAKTSQEKNVPVGAQIGTW